MEYTTDLLEILNHIDPSHLNYQEWCCVGMALKYEGYSPYDWDSWSQKDSKRYHQNECLKKWDTRPSRAEVFTSCPLFLSI